MSHEFSVIDICAVGLLEVRFLGKVSSSSKQPPTEVIKRASAPPTALLIIVACCYGRHDKVVAMFLAQTVAAGC